MTTSCDQCKSIGLPILLARYAVVPSTISQSLPGWASGDKVNSVALGGEYKYALRTLRAGYVYLLYGKGPRGSKYWECYSIGDDGSMILQPSTAMAQPQATPVLLCTRNGHTNQNVYFIVIQEPHKCGPVWIAFSEHKWSEDTLARYKADAALRDKRMQTIQPPAMAGGAKHSHGQIADAAVLKDIIEFAPREATLAALPHGGNAGAVSSADGSHVAAALNKQSTRYPWHFKDDIAQPVVDRMIARGKTPDPNDKDAKPHVLALWDAVGITHELNGFRNDAAGAIAKYGNERELEITAMNAIEGVKKALENRGEDRARDYLQSERDWRAMGYEPALVQGRRARALTAPDSPLKTAELRHCELMDYIGQKGLWHAFEFDLSRIQMDTDTTRRMASYDQFKARVDAHIAAQPQQERQLIDESRGHAARDWQKYEKKLRPGAQAAFKQKYDAFLDAADKLVDVRTVELIKWLEAPLLISTLKDYHERNVNDGVAFADLVGDAIFGIASSKSGAEKIDEWVKQAKASVETNLLWRAIALNQEEAVAEIDAALAAALADHTMLTAANVSTTGIIIKQTQRLADVYKKAQTVANTNINANAGAKAFGVELKAMNTRGTDKFAITAGDAVFKFFRVDKPGTYLSEKLIQHIFSIRAFVDPQDSLRLIVSQSMNQVQANGQLLERFKTAKAFLASDSPQVRTAQRVHLEDAWSSFKTSGAGAAAIKDARLALVVGLIEGVNFGKLIALDVALDGKRDPRVVAQITASAMTVTAALLDVASVPAKSLFGNEAWSFQRLKLMGGVLAGGAAFIGAVIDVVDFDKQRRKERYGLASLYFVKSMFGFASALATGFTAFTYAAPLVQRLTGRAAAGTAMRVVGARAAAMVGARILFMSAGAWITLGIFGIQALIWIFTDDALQEWCEESAFGTRRNAGWVAEPSGQMQALDKALVEVM
jgi:hypothetical protein